MRRVIGLRFGRAIAMAVAISHPHANAADPVHEVQVVAKKFTFEPPTIQVAAGEPVRLVIRSSDTVHGFAIRELKIDLQLPRDGTPVVAEFIAPRAGRYEIACSEFCGSGHGQMKAALMSVGPTPTAR